MELMLSSLPPRIARMSWFSALRALDEESASIGANADFTGSVLRVMAAALKLEPLTDPKTRRKVYPIRLLSTPEGKLSGVMAGRNGEAIFTAQQMGEVRQILAAQNDYEIPDENWNTDLLAAQRYTEAQKKRGNGSVRFDLETLVYSVAAGAHVRASEVWGWPIREFRETENAIDRQLNYVVCALTEAGGHLTYKGGNPCPTWKLNRTAELPGDFVRLDELHAGAKGLLDDKTSL